MKISNNFHTFRSVSCCCKLSFCILPSYWKDNEVFLYDNLANIYVSGIYYTLQCAGFQWEMLPSISFKNWAEKWERAKSLRKSWTSCLLGGMTLAGLDPTNGQFIPKVNSWSKGGCWAHGVGGIREQEDCAEWPASEESLLQLGIWGSTALAALPAARTTLKTQILGLKRIRWQCSELVCGVTLAGVFVVLSLHLP